MCAPPFSAVPLPPLRGAKVNRCASANGHLAHTLAVRAAPAPRAAPRAAPLRRQTCRPGHAGRQAGPNHGQGPEARGGPQHRDGMGEGGLNRWMSNRRCWISRGGAGRGQVGLYRAAGGLGADCGLVLRCRPAPRPAHRCGAQPSTRPHSACTAVARAASAIETAVKLCKLSRRPRRLSLLLLLVPGDRQVAACSGRWRLRGPPGAGTPGLRRRVRLGTYTSRPSRGVDPGSCLGVKVRRLLIVGTPRM